MGEPQTPSSQTNVTLDKFDSLTVENQRNQPAIPANSIWVWLAGWRVWVVVETVNAASCSAQGYVCIRLLGSTYCGSGLIFYRIRV